jgi:hypothetical protein
MDYTKFFLEFMETKKIEKEFRYLADSNIEFFNPQTQTKKRKQ